MPLPAPLRPYLLLFFALPLLISCGSSGGDSASNSGSSGGEPTPLSVPSFSQAPLPEQAIELPRDNKGWTSFTPSSDSRIVYVSNGGDDSSGQVYAASDSELGSNPFQPTGAIRSFATFAAALAQTRDNMPDWILLKRGDTFYQSIGCRKGRSASEPFVIASYGDSGPAPLLKTGAASGISQGRGFSWLALVGLNFYAHTRNPDDPDYVDATGGSGFNFLVGDGAEGKGLLIEGCVFRFYRGNVVQAWQSATIYGVVIRRCVIVDNYSADSHSQGLYTNMVDGIVLEENIFDHNGWYKVRDGDFNDQAEGKATMFNHNTYFTNARHATFVGNVFTRPSSIGSKWTANNGENSASNITIHNNLYVDHEVGISIGGNVEGPYRFKDIIVSGNVLSRAGNSQQTGRTLGWGIGIQDWDNGLASGNYIINQPLEVINNCYGFSLSGDMRYVTIENNVVAKARYTHGVSFGEGGSRQQVVVRGNSFNLTDSPGYLVNANNLSSLAGLSFASNHYFSSRQEDEQFRYHGLRLSWDEWLEASQDSSTMAPIDFVDDSRSLAGYMASLGEEASLDAFYARCRAQERYSWDSRFTAAAANQWLKAGFQEAGQ